MAYFSLKFLASEYSNKTWVLPLINTDQCYMPCEIGQALQMTQETEIKRCMQTQSFFTQFIVKENTIQTTYL